MASQLAAPRPPQWGVYFPGDAYAADDRRALLVRELAAFFGAPAGAALLARARPWHGRAVLPLDWAALAAAEGAPRDLPEALRHAPGEALACLAVAAHAFLLPRSAAAGDDDDETDANAAGEPPRVLVRLANHAESFTKVSDVRADSVGRLVTLRGTVTRATPARPLVVACDFSCAKCGAAQRARFADGRFAPPPICGVDGCRSPRLAPVRASAAAVDWRRVALQGLPADERPAQGRVPAQLEVELLEELASAATPGDVVAVTGIVRVLAGAAGGRAASGGGGDAAKRQCLFVPYVEALSVAAAGAAAGGGFAGGAAAGGEVVAQPEGPSYLPPGMPGFTALDLRFIRAFAAGAAGGDALRQLARSLAPGLCGMEGPKAGLVLALLGGARKGGGGGALPLRADVHVLLVGDPGLGKSALLRAAAAAAPRGVYVCGPRVSAAGLTASATRVDGGFAFDAGALALADRGACCVDEFDKASGEHAALLGAMEQGEVAVAKGGLVAALPARAAVLAAANPAGGAYRRGATLADNLRMSPALLSRFDLIFLLLDRPDAERDARLTEHVMRARAGLAPRPPPALLEGPAPAATGAARPPLMDRLREARADDEPLPPVLLRKYIAYARQYVHPRLGAEAAAVLKRFYLRLRAAAAADAGALPATHRALESLVRLAEARARAELRERVTAEDAEDAVAVVTETLDGLAAAGVGLVDFGEGRGAGAGGAAGGRGAQAERRRFVAALCAHCAAKGDAALPAHELYAVADRIELAVPDTGAFLEALREAGDLLKRGPGAFELAGFALPGGGGAGGGAGGRRPLESINGGGDASGGGYGGW